MLVAVGDSLGKVPVGTRELPSLHRRRRQIRVGAAGVVLQPERKRAREALLDLRASFLLASGEDLRRADVRERVHDDLLGADALGELQRPRSPADG